MKKTFIFLKLFLCVMLAFSLAACERTNGLNLVKPPEKISKIISVMIQYNGMDVKGGVISVDLSMETLNLTANVTKTDEKADDTVTFTSNNNEVATITNSGVVTLLSKGESVISASVGDEKHEVVLVVGDDYAPVPQKYAITVVGGTSDWTSASEGSYVTLKAGMPERMNFVKWEYRIDDELVDNLWINGNIFEMPSADITVTAIYEDMLYTLNVVRGTVKGDDSGELKEDIMVYKFKYGQEVTVVADLEPSEKMFVGWDYKAKNNRVGELGDTEYGPFTMPDETLTIWAVYSDISTMGFPANGAIGFNSSTDGFKVITKGVPFGEPQDPDLEGMSGYRLAINGNSTPTTVGDYSLENIKGSNLSNLHQGSQTLKAIFKNHHPTLSVTVELYANQYDTLATSGITIIPAGGVVTVVFMANLGFHNPHFGIDLRDNIGGEEGDFILLDMVVEKAATYPEGDKQFEVSGAAEWVNLSNYTVGGTFAGIKGVNNDWGMSAILGWSTGIEINSYIRASVTNMPKYSPDEPTTKVYFRVINASDNDFSFKFNFGTNTNPITGEGASLCSYDLFIEGKAVELFVIEIPRINNDQIYFSIIEDNNDSYDQIGYGITLQMAYNNVIGVQ